MSSRVTLSATRNRFPSNADPAATWSITGDAVSCTIALRVSARYQYQWPKELYISVVLLNVRGKLGPDSCHKKSLAPIVPATEL